MSSVIVGVDDSPAAPAVARAGARLAGRLGLRLVLAHAVETPRVFPYGDVAKTEFERRRAIRDARPMLERVDPVPGGADSYRVAFGAPADALSQVAYEENGALLVVGSGGRDTLPSAATGSVSRALAHEGLVPVVVVPLPAATDDCDQEAEDAPLIVVGSRGRGVLSEMLSRSTAGAPASGAARPLLVVPQDLGVVDPASAARA